MEEYLALVKQIDFEYLYSGMSSAALLTMPPVTMVS
jgi:hypothetical protein